MGAEHSRTRKLSLENEEATSVIKVSDDVVQRLKGNQNKGPVSSLVNPEAPSPASWPTIPGGGGAPLGYPPPYFYEPSLTSLQIRQEKEAALKNNDKYWEKRVLDLEKIHGQMHQVMEAEYHKAVKEVKGEEEDVAKCHAPPCYKRKKAVMECYKRHPREPMRCNKEVEAFAECVDVQRSNLMANRS